MDRIYMAGRQFDEFGASMHLIACVYSGVLILDSPPSDLIDVNHFWRREIALRRRAGVRRRGRSKRVGDRVLASNWSARRATKRVEKIAGRSRMLHRHTTGLISTRPATSRAAAGRILRATSKASAAGEREGVSGGRSPRFPREHGEAGRRPGPSIAPGKETRSVRRRFG
jgi:hypothetical protein